MKKLEELGISKTPWKEIYRSHSPYPAFCHVSDPDGDLVVEVSGENDEMLKANALLIAAAPKLYSTLREGIIEICGQCPSCSGCPEYECKSKSNCFIQRWRKVLDEVAGEGGTK